VESLLFVDRGNHRHRFDCNDDFVFVDAESVAAAPRAESYLNC